MNHTTQAKHTPVHNCSWRARGSGGFCGRMALVAGLVLATAAAVAQTTAPLTVRAWATLAANVGPQMEVRINGVVVGSTEVRASGYQNYTFPSVNAPAGAKLELVFNNDAFASDGDRNLFVESVTVNGSTIVADAPGVVFDRGAGAQAFDNLDVLPGLSTLYWNGALRFTVPSASTLPPTTPPATPTDTPPAGYSRCAAEWENCSFTGTADVVYGALNTWTAPRSFSGGTACTNTVFGDPLRGTVKACYMKPTSTTPTPLGLNLTLVGSGGVGFSDGSACASSCTRTFNSGSTVTLAAAPASGYTFTGWGGACSGTASTCTVTMDAAKNVSATFSAVVVTRTLSLTLTGTGGVGFSDGSSCASSCTRTFNNGSVITLAASPSAGFSFSGWTGACNGTSPNCTLTLNASVSVGAAFSAVTSPPNSQADAARLLIQATYGPTMAEIQRVANMGPAAWIDDQFTTPSMDSHWDYAVVRRGPPGCTVCNSNFINAVMESFWLQAVRGPDQLRQRTVLALSEIFVVSNVNSTIDGITNAHASYLDMLSRNAFGNFRQLLEQVSTHPAMGKYLSHFGNEREDVATGRIPDENYAREVMQLFSIGLWQLNPDGTRRRDGSGNFIPTYNQSDVSGLARVFTGWSWNGPDKSYGRWKGWVEENWRDQMQNYPDFHSTSEKRFLNVTIPPNTSGEQSLRIALDTLFNHPNVGPFIGRQLIQRFVTSNPSPAYVGRVAAAFNNNGQGVRGDMRAVLRAVLLDQEARDVNTSNQPTWGKLREPMVRFGNWMRAFDARSSNGVYAIWNLEDNVSSLGQNPLRAPSVFNWFRPDYAPPGQILNQGLFAPEFQITHETTVTGYANFVAYTAERGHGWGTGAILPNYTAEVALANNPAALMDRLNALLTAGRMTATTRQVIINAINEIPASQASRRVHMAVALTMVSPEFIVQK